MVRPYVKNMREAPSNQAANTTPQAAQPTSRIRALHATAKGLPHLPQSVLKPLQQSPTAGALLWVPAAGLPAAAAVATSVATAAAATARC
jgi:hypothetical protein